MCAVLDPGLEQFMPAEHGVQRPLVLLRKKLRSHTQSFDDTAPDASVVELGWVVTHAVH
jgi:hypothetical protein